MVAVATVVFVNGSPCQQRWQWDGGAMMQWHLRQWHLGPMVAVVMVVDIVNFAAVADGAFTIPSLTSMAAAKMPSPPLPLTAASINDNCYCRPLPLPYS
jgi:hypothetical protein